MSMDDCRSFPLSLGQNDICKFFSCGDHSNLLEIVIRHIFSMNRLLFMRIIFHKSQIDSCTQIVKGKGTAGAGTFYFFDRGRE